MRTLMTVSAALLAIVASAQSAAAQRSSGGGGTIGCDPSLPTFAVQASSCRIFFKEALYGPAANPYASAWGHRYVVEPAPARPVKKKKKSKSGARNY